MRWLNRMVLALSLAVATWVVSTFPLAEAQSPTRSPGRAAAPAAAAPKTAT